MLGRFSEDDSDELNTCIGCGETTDECTCDDEDFDEDEEEEDFDDEDEEEEIGDEDDEPLDDEEDE